MKIYFCIFQLFKMKLYLKCENNLVKDHYRSIANNSSSTSYNYDSGIDLVTSHDIVVPKGSKGYKIKHHISCKPFEKHGYYLYPRSSISKTPLRLSNSVGIIDYGYRGDIIACVDNVGDVDYKIPQGTRIVQLCAPDLKPIELIVVDEFEEDEDNDRGSGGFGSTN